VPSSSIYSPQSLVLLAKLGLLVTVSNVKPVPEFCLLAARKVYSLHKLHFAFVALLLLGIILNPNPEPEKSYPSQNNLSHEQVHSTFISAFKRSINSLHVSN